MSTALEFLYTCGAHLAVLIAVCIVLARAR